MKRGVSCAAYATAVLVAGLALSACGSTKNAAKSTSGSTSAAGPKGAPIVVGSICSCSGAEASLLGDTADVSKAWANSVNAAGGINGHRVKMIVEDDGGNATTALQDAKQLVSQDHVVAIVGDDSYVDSSFASYLAGKGIPVVGGSSGEPVFASNPDWYASGSTLTAELVGAVARATGKKRLGLMYCAETPVCAQLGPLITGIGTLFGLKVTTASISATAPSYAAPCLAMKSAGVAAMFVSENGPVVARVLAGCQQQGFDPVNVGVAAEATASFLDDSAVSGMLLADTNANPYDPSLPAVKQYQDALNRYYPGTLTSSSYSPNAFSPWTAGMLFEAAAKAADIGPESTPADVKKGLYALKGDTLGGIAPPLTFTPGKPFATTCWFTQKVAHGTFESLNGDKVTCLSTTQAAALAKVLKP